jgi:hypothetical protein
MEILLDNYDKNAEVCVTVQRVHQTQGQHLCVTRYVAAECLVADERRRSA